MWLMKHFLFKVLVFFLSLGLLFSYSIEQKTKTQKKIVSSGEQVDSLVESIENVISSSKKSIIFIRSQLQSLRERFSFSVLLAKYRSVRRVRKTKRFARKTKQVLLFQCLSDDFFFRKFRKRRAFGVLGDAWSFQKLSFRGGFSPLFVFNGVAGKDSFYSFLSGFSSSLVGGNVGFIYKNLYVFYLNLLPIYVSQLDVFALLYSQRIVKDDLFAGFGFSFMRIPVREVVFFGGGSFSSLFAISFVDDFVFKFFVNRFTSGSFS